MDKIVIEGGHRLEGSVRINGAKKYCLAYHGSLFVVKRPIPDKGDTQYCRYPNSIENTGESWWTNKRYEDGTLEIMFRDGENNDKYTAPYELVRKMRASICVLGPLLSKRHKAKVSYPGGCVIGQRPVDLHISGLRALGARIETTEGYINATADRLKGTEISLKGKYGSTVLGTCNVMSAAVLAEGTTIIEDAAREPEVQDLANFLNKAGAKFPGLVKTN